MQILHPRASRTRARAALAALVPLFLAACGGSGGGSAPPPPPPPSNSALVYGTAAAGAAVAGTVVVEDTTGRTVTLPVAAGSGAFSAAVDGMTAPFMLKVTSSDGSTVLYSAIPQPGRANITPLTSLALMRIAASRGQEGPADLYAQPASFASWDTTSNLAAAASTMLSRLMPAFTAQLPGAPSTPQTAPTYDPFGTAWTVGAGVDSLLDAYPVTFTTDGTGVVTALQTDHASGLAVDIARSDTANSIATGLDITGAGQGIVVGGSAIQFGAQARFAGGAQQPVSPSWSVSGLAGASVDSNGKVSAPAVDTAATITVTARWFDGVQASVATLDMTVVPTMRPMSLEITGASPNASVAAGASLALGATVHWSDGSTTTPAASWSFTGDAAAVMQLGSDGLLRTGKPTSDSPIVVTAAFSQAGVPVSAQLPLIVAHFVRRVQSVSLTGLASGQVLTAGDHADLTLTTLWNDGTESTLSPTWASGAVPGATHNIATSVSTTGKLTTASYYVPATADAGTRAAEFDVLQATYDNGDGSTGQVSVPFSVKPLVNIPTGIEIRGATAMAERATASFQVFVDYADGTALASSDASMSSQDPTLLLATPTAGAFSGAAYPNPLQQPAALLTGTLTATRSFTYQDENGQQATATFNASQRVEIDWVAPAIVSLDAQVDHLAVGQATPVGVVGTLVKFTSVSSIGLSVATFSTDSSIVTSSGTTLTAQAPASVEATWVTLTTSAANPWTGDITRSSKRITVDLPGTVAKHLLPHDYSPLDPEVQFRAISSDGHVDDYTVVRSDGYGLGYASAATRRRLPLFSGATAFEQSRLNPTVNASAQESAYDAAIEQGRVVVIRHDDLYLPSADNSLARPIVLPDMTNARSLAIVARPQDSTQSAAVRVYVLDQAGTIRQYALPYYTNVPLKTGDAVFQRQLPGTWTQISGGSDFVELLASDGGAWIEGEFASGALSDPGHQSHWDAPFAMQQGFDCTFNCTRYTPITGVTQLHAGFQTSWMAIADTGIESINERYAQGILSWSGNSAPVPQTPPPAIAQLAVWAALDTSGVVHYYSAYLSQGDDAGGANDLSQPASGQWMVATWLPTIVEIVDGRREVALNRWPDISFEMAALPAMPIVRAANDTLFYLDGNQIIDGAGHALVLP